MGTTRMFLPNTFQGTAERWSALSDSFAYISAKRYQNMDFSHYGGAIRVTEYSYN